MTHDPAIAEHRVQALTIACPDGWRDKSMLILNADTPGASGVNPTIVVTRETGVDDLPADRVGRLEGFVDRQLHQMGDALAGLAVIERVNASETQWTAELTIEWEADGTPLRQWITYADAGDGALVLATATAGRTDFAAAEPAFRSILKTVRLS